jgi:O-antigen ligase
MASFCLWLWGIIMVFGVLFWRRYPPGHEFRRVSLVLMVVATIVAAGILPIFAIADREDTDRLAAVKQLEPLQRAWRGNHPQPP